MVDAVRAPVQRILSLDVDGSDFAAVGQRDEVVARLQRLYPGLRPVGFWSPYEAAAWAIIGQRIRIRRAAASKARIAERLGEPVNFRGRVVHAFPPPERLAELDGFPGLFGRKLEWLRSVASAAIQVASTPHTCAPWHRRKHSASCSSYRASVPSRSSSCCARGRIPRLDPST